MSDILLPLELNHEGSAPSLISGDLAVPCINHIQTAESGLSREQLEVELKRLRKENRRLEMEREILKKATVCSTDQRNTLTDNKLERWCVWHKWDDLGSLLPRSQIFGIDGNTVNH